MTENEFKQRFQLGRDYLVKPYELPVVQPDHPGDVPPDPKKVKCFECGYCQFSSIHFDELIRHFNEDRSHPFKYGATGVHPELTGVHPELHDRHVARVQLNRGLPKDVEEYEEAGSDSRATTPVKPVPAAVAVAAKTPAVTEVVK